MNIQKTNSLLKDAVKRLDETIISKRRLLKPSEMDVEPYKKGMWKVSHMGGFIALLVKDKRGWKATTQAGSTEWVKSKEEALKQAARKAPNAVVHPDGSAVGKYPTKVRVPKGYF